MRLCTSGACERDAKSIIVRLSAQVSPATNDMIRASLIDNVTVIPTTSAAIEASSMARGCADRPASQWSNGSSAHCASAATVPLSLRRSQYSLRMRLRSSSRSMSSSATASAYRTACVFVSCPISWSPLPVSSTAGARCRRPPPRDGIPSTMPYRAGFQGEIQPMWSKACQACKSAVLVFVKPCG